MSRTELPLVVEPGSDAHLALLAKAYGRAWYAPEWLMAYARDVYRAGRVDGERVRQALPSIRQRVTARRKFTVDLAIELLISASTLAGMRLGSTTLHGIECYFVSTGLWCLVTWRKRMHGVWPLNIGALVVMLLNLKDVLA